MVQQDEPPEPVRKDVAIERDEAACYWVASFGGWPSEKKYRGRADDMISALTNQVRYAAAGMRGSRLV